VFKKNIVKRFVQCFIFAQAPPGWQTLPTVPDLFKTVLLAVLFGRNCNSYTTSTQSDTFIYAQIVNVVEAVVGQKK
jgi:hypothetical protein